MATRRDMFEGGVLGALVGDALGVPYEFKAAHELPPADRIEFSAPPGFDRSHGNVPPGTWSDDGALLLALMESLLDHKGRFDANDFGGRLVAWRREGRLAVDGAVFDVGMQTEEAIRRIASGTPAAGAGPAGDRNNGNGSLMRTLPVALLCEGDDEDLVDLAHRQSRVTHGHPRSEACCALYALWAKRTLAGAGDPWAEATRSLRRIYFKHPAHAHELETEIRPDDPAPGTGTPYVVDALRSARWCVGRGSYEAVVRAAVGLGQDADTTACIAGGIAGLRDGVAAIPSRWRAALRGREILDPLLRRLLSHADYGGPASSSASAGPIQLF